MGWGDLVAVRRDKFVYSFKSENLERGDELQYTDVGTCRSEPI